MRIVIVHYGEDVPTDDGYRPLRYGQMASRWVAAGHEVTRISPSFSHLRRARRARRDSTSREGHHRVIRTPSYGSSRGWRRAAFLVAWVVGSAITMRRMQSGVDRFLVGHPPPGTVALYRLLGGRRPVTVDIRDAWFRRTGSVFTRTLAQVAELELRLADTTIALSTSLAAWTGRDDVAIVPIGVADHDPERMDGERIPPSGPVRCVFVGTLNDRFRLVEWVERWSRDGSILLDVFGDGPTRPMIEQAASGHAGVAYRGRLSSDDVPARLATYDVGITPTSPGFGTHPSNKVAEYLASGLYVLHSLEWEPTEFLAGHDLGVRADPSSLPDVLDELAERASEIRDRRAVRIQTARDLMGWDHLAARCLELVIGADS